MLEVRKHINEVLQYYAVHEVSWNISGWYKPGIRANDEHVREPKHLCNLRHTIQDIT